MERKSRRVPWKEIRPSRKDRAAFETEEDPDLYRMFRYRGYRVTIYQDDDGQCLYAVIAGKRVGFGSFNLLYQDDCMFLIDDEICQKVENTKK